MKTLTICVTPLGIAAAQYLQARSNFWDTLNDTIGPDHCPEWNSPEVNAARKVMETTAEAYRELEGYICEDCGTLEGCCCPNV